MLLGKEKSKTLPVYLSAMSLLLIPKQGGFRTGRCRPSGWIPRVFGEEPTRATELV